jgi:hypothetical protein
LLQQAIERKIIFYYCSIHNTEQIKKRTSQLHTAVRLDAEQNDDDGRAITRLAAVYKHPQSVENYPNIKIIISMHREAVKYGRLESSLLHPEIQIHIEAVKHTP